MIQIFDISNGKPVPSVHCTFVPELRDVIEFYPEDYLKVLAYIQYTTCLDPSLNPYMNTEEDMREQVVLADLAPIPFSLEEPVLLEAIQKCKKLYETPIDRSFVGAKHMLDKMARMLMTEEITTTGKDANITALRGLIKDMPDLWKTYKELTLDLLGEQAKVRGGIRRSYDQMPGYRNTKADNNTEKDSI